MKAQSQRQLRAGELVRRAVSDILREGHVRDPALKGVPVTVSEARVSPDLRNATVFVSAMNLADPERVAEALNRASGFIQKELGRQIDMKFTPKLRFIGDDRFDEATHVDEVLDRPSVKRDLDEGGEGER
ncbi:MAG: 30S ribosome-binding factor RbfA [Oceanicaulis sp.]